MLNIMIMEKVHYRVGSLEIAPGVALALLVVHCRIGMTKILTIIYQSEFAIIT